MKKRWKLFASMFGGTLIAAMLCVCFCQMKVKAGEDREVTQGSIMNYVVEIDNYSEDQIAKADLNKDGTVNMLDAVIAERIDVYGEDYLEKGTADKETADKETTDKETADKETADKPSVDTEDKDNKTDETSNSENSTDIDTSSNDKSDEDGNVVYLNMLNTNWTQVYIYSWETGTLFTPMKAVEGYKGVYKAVLPEGVTEFLFINNKEEQWDNNRQSINVTFGTSGSTYVLESPTNGKYSGAWKEIVYK